MNINNLTIGQVKEIQALLGLGSGAEHPYLVGEKYFVRTVTQYYVGRLVAVYEQELVFQDTSWVANTGRFSSALAGGGFEEVEPYPGGGVVIIGRGAIVDASVFRGEIPMGAK